MELISYLSASTEAIRRVLEVGYGKTISRKQKLDLSGVKWIRMGTTVVCLGQIGLAVLR